MTARARSVRSLTVATAALLAAGLVPAAPAGAAGPADTPVAAAATAAPTLFFLRWNDDPGDNHLVAARPSGEGEVRLLPDVDAVSFDVHPDGRRFALNAEVPTASGQKRWMIAVANLAGDVRTLFDYNDLPERATTPRFSADGKHVFYGRVLSRSGTQVSELWRVPTAGGTRARIRIPNVASVYDADPHPTKPNVLVASLPRELDAGGTRTRNSDRLIEITVSGTSSTARYVGTAQGIEPAYSPDGRWIAYAWADKLHVVSVDGRKRFTRALGALWTARRPAWHPSGGHIYLVRTPAGPGLGDVVRVPFSGTALGGVQQVTDTVLGNECCRVAVAPSYAPLPADDTAPLPPTRLTAALGGTRPVLRWKNSTSIDWQQTLLLRRSDGQTPTAPDEAGTTVVYRGRGTSFTDTVPAVDAPYTYAVVARDAAGNVSGPGATRSIVALRRPVVRVPLLASSDDAAATVNVQWAPGGAPASAFYEVQWSRRVKTAKGWVLQPWASWYDETPAPNAHFGLGGPTDPLAGETYYVRVRSKDPYGNATTWVTGRWAQPVDERTGRFAGTWRSVAADDRWQGTLRTTNQAGASVTFTATGSTYRLVGDKCSTCGKFRVYVDGALVGTFDSRAATQPRSVLWASGTLPVKQRTIRIVNVATSGRPWLKVDAFAAIR